MCQKVSKGKRNTFFKYKIKRERIFEFNFGFTSFKDRRQCVAVGIAGWFQRWEMIIRNDFAFHVKKRAEGEKTVRSGSCFYC